MSYGELSNDRMHLTSARFVKIVQVSGLKIEASRVFVMVADVLGVQVKCIDFD